MVIANLFQLEHIITEATRITEETQTLLEQTSIRGQCR